MADINVTIEESTPIKITVVEWWNGWGWGWSCAFEWVYQTPSWVVSWTTCQEWIDLHFPSNPPTMRLRWTTFAFWLHEVGKTLTTPLIEWRWTLWSNPAGTLTSLSITETAFNQTNPTPWARYWNNDSDVNIVLWNTITYHWQIQDSEWRNASASGSYIWVYPRYATSNTITTLTKQTLQDWWPYEFTSVAESWADKEKCDIIDTEVITGIQFYNTVSWAWERLNWSQSASLTSFTVTSVNHTVQWNVVWYNRYTHNWIKCGERQYRFFTD